MAVKKEIEIVVKSDQAVQGLNRVEDALERVDKAAEQATEETKGLGEEVGESGAAISLLDAATGGLATKVRDVAEVYKTFRGRIVNVTAAQIKANLAFLANPFALVGASIGALTIAFSSYVSKVTNEVVPAIEVAKNAFLSLGNFMNFNNRMIQSVVKNSVDEQVKQTERAIAVLKAYGENTIDLEIENQRRRTAVLQKGTQEYFDARTQLSILLAQKDVQETEKARQAKIAELEELQRVEDERKANEQILSEFDRGADEAIAYAEGRLFGKQQAEQADPEFDYIDIRKLELEEEINLEFEAAKKKKEIEETLRDQKINIAQQTFGAIAGILGQNSKVGKAAGIAQAIINTYQGVTEVLSNKTTLPEPFGTIQKIASTATVLASGFQAVRAMQQTPIPVIASGGFGGGGGGGAIASAPPQINTVGASSINQLAQTISGQTKEPVRAYVVAGDVTSAQSLERNTIKEASI
jgi:hypothetical protein